MFSALNILILISYRILDFYFLDFRIAWKFYYYYYYYYYYYRYY